MSKAIFVLDLKELTSPGMGKEMEASFPWKSFTVPPFSFNEPELG